MALRGKGIHIAGRLSYREAIESLWRAQPHLTRRQVYAATGAPWKTIEYVRGQLVKAGVLSTHVSGFGVAAR